jgi:DNA-binding NarL/FixJ family response regulator
VLRGCRVLVIEDDPIVRAGWEAVLSGVPWVGATASVADLAGGVAEIRRGAADVALVSLFVHETHGVDICRGLLCESPGLRVVLVTDFSGLPVSAARAAGARGLVHRGWPIAAILDVLARVADGEACFPVSHAGAGAGGGSRLSRRERAVLSMLASGASNAEIAGELHLSPHTIKEYTQTVFRKLGVRNRVEAATAATRLGYAD